MWLRCSTAAQVDPRQIVTDVAFRVEPGLLGADLANPWRRGCALLLDLLLAAMVSSLGGAGVVACLTGAVAYRVVAGQGQRRFAALRIITASFGAVIAFGVTFAAVSSRGSNGDAGPAVAAALGDGVAVNAKGRREDPERSDPRDPDVATSSGAAERTEDEVGQALKDAVLAFTSPDGASDDGEKQAEAVANAVAGIAKKVADANSDASLKKRLGVLAAENADLREQLERPSIVRTLRGAAEDFGLTFGWVGAYFTLFLAWWNGFTPGKRLFGIRAYRLDGQPFTMWLAFERFAGYAAGLATGLLGFVQIFWDPNRQGIHDRIAGTVVVRMTDAKTPRRKWTKKNSGLSRPAEPSA